MFYLCVSTLFYNYLSVNFYYPDFVFILHKFIVLHLRNETSNLFTNELAFFNYIASLFLNYCTNQVVLLQLKPRFLVT